MPPRRASAYIAAVLIAGAAVLANALAHWHVSSWSQYLTLLTLALLSSRFKVGLPGVTGTLSANYVFILLGISELGLPGTIVMACAAMAVQSLVNTRRRPLPIQVAFNVAATTCSAEIGFLAYQLAGRGAVLGPPLRLLCAAAGYFILNTLSVSTVIALSEQKRPHDVWRQSYLWTFPNYLVGAAVAWAMAAASRAFGWQVSILIVPVLYALYRSHTLHVQSLAEAREKVEREMAHSEQMRALQRRTIETLALAVEAKDGGTREHLERVECYAVAVGLQMGLGPIDMEALRAAAILHDVGKIAVPEYIISKPGKLTPAEFDKMKTHTVLGAEIVDQIRFPYPVAPIVRGHHEKWDGSGYPDGLAHEQIPLGARILAAVDFFDAMTSDRPYRRALPAAEAIAMLKRDAGRAFDPDVVEVLVRCIREGAAQQAPGTVGVRLSTNVRVERGAAPGAGFQADSAPDLLNLQRSLEQLIPAPSKVPEAPFDRLREALQPLVPHAAIAVYAVGADHLDLIAADSGAFPGFFAPRIRRGAGLCGWVAENGLPIINGNPGVEPGFTADPVRFAALRSAAAVPLVNEGSIAAVLALYRSTDHPFSERDITVLETLGLQLLLHPARIPPRASDPAPLQLPAANRPAISA